VTVRKKVNLIQRALDITQHSVHIQSSLCWMKLTVHRQCWMLEPWS